MNRVACVLATLGAVAANGVSFARPPGPDVIVGELLPTLKYDPVGGKAAYAIGTLSCNVGSAVALWIPGTNQHPVIAQAIYRLKDGRFEQLGISWLKHAYAATTGSFCDNCVNPGTTQRLGIGCSDPYFASINAEHFNLGPRSEVNAFTGAYAFPFVLGWQQSGNAIFKRCQVLVSDLDPALNTGALYFGEGQYVTSDEAAFGNQFNNASYKRMSVGAASGGTWLLDFVGTENTQQTKPAIFAWRERTGGVSGDDDTGVTIVQVDVPGEGRFYLGCRVTALGGGLWEYEYALQNLNSHRSAGSFSIPAPSGLNVSQIGFHDVDYHSGEPYSGTDWPGAQSGGSLTWSTTPFATDANANALRWGTLYNFRFVANQPPDAGTATIGLFRPGSPTSVAVAISVPQTPPPPTCPGDANGDHIVNGADLSVLLSQFAQGVPAGTGADFNGDGLVNGADLSVLLSNFGAMCA